MCLLPHITAHKVMINKATCLFFLVKASILDAFTRRINNDQATEFLEACHQVELIAKFRLIDLLP